MSELTAEFDTIIGQIESAVTNGLYGIMRDGLMEELGKKAREKVYTYNAAPYFMAKRRYEIADKDNFSFEVGGMTLRATNLTALQCGEAGEVDIVELGAGWHQPGPRPFMELGLSDYVWARGSEDLVTVLQDAGFDAHVG